MTRRRDLARLCRVWRRSILALVLLAWPSLGWASPLAARTADPPAGDAQASDPTARVRHYESRILHGEAVRVTSDMPLQERNALLTAWANLMMSRSDLDGSGGLDAAEWLERDWQYELLYDADRDQRITRDEYVQGRTPGTSAGDRGLADFRAAMARRDTQRFNRLSGGQDALQRSRLQRESNSTFRAHDVDRDGEVTPADMERVSRGESRR